MTVWTTREGEEIPISELETSHLCNIISMLTERAAPHLERGGFPPGDTHRVFPIIHELRAEMDRRLEAQRVAEIGEEHPTETRARLLELE